MADGYCPTCRTTAMLNARGQCVWCDTVVHAPPDLRRVPVCMTDDVVERARILYFGLGFTLREVAAVVHADTDYASEWACANGIRQAFINSGLALRDRSARRVAAC